VTTAPLVSVIIASYNRADVLGEAIDSALAQSYPSVEVIVVDDGSSDGTPELLRAYGDRIVVRRQANAGYAAARNTGMRLARGRYVAWLDSDDVFRPDMIALQASVLERHPDVVLVSTDFEAFDARGPRPESSVRSYYTAFARIPGGAETIYDRAEVVEHAGASIRVRIGRVRHHLLNGSFVHPPTVMLRRDAALEAGNLDERLRTSVEYPFFFRLARLGAFAFIDHPLLRYRLSLDALSGEGNSRNMALTILRILEELPGREPDVVGAAPDLYRRRLAAGHLNAAGALAETNRVRAALELWRAVRGGLLTTAMISVWLRILLPSTAVHGVRTLKRLARPRGR
jgi:glycosyltransferase involved in cell wall biosynthesis